jgi:hypothetical protein
MNDKLTSYILFVFAKHDEQEKFITSLAEELSVISDSLNIKFYYGPESGIFTFDTMDDFPIVKEYMEIMFCESKIVYMLLPYEHDKMSVGLTDDIYNHLFTQNISENMSGFEPEAQKMLSKELKERVDLFFDKITDDEDEDDEIKKIKSKLPIPSLDNLLDKIKDKGMVSLTKKELSLLEQYSK